MTATHEATYEVQRIDPAEVEALRARVRGEVVEPDDPGYDAARAVYNAMHDRRPALVVRAADVADVVAAVGFARERGLLLAVRGGGHSIAGFSTCDGGVVLDLGAMRGIRMDPARRLARVEGGATWGDFNHATHAFGLATTGGVVSTTGVAGLTLGGGIGHLSRLCGLACDNLVSADVVTADGEFLTASAEEHADLFWALRGGGGNFGVVTSFEFRLHPVETVVGGPTVFPLDAGVVRAYRDFMCDAPEGLGAVLALAQAPPLPFVPAEWHGRPAAIVLACWAGPAEEGQALIDSFADWGEVVGRFVGPMPYPAINTLFDDLLPRGLQHYWKAAYVRELPEEAIAAHLEHASRVPTLESGGYFFPVDGAVHRVAAGATAFPHRDARFALGIFGSWRDAGENDANSRWVRDYDAAVRPFADESAYVNWTSADERDRAAANYGASYGRLVEVKRRYDPDNLFRLNQNIVP